MLSGESFQVSSVRQDPVGVVSFAPVVLGSGDIVEPDLVPEPGLVVHEIDAFLRIDFLTATLIETVLKRNLTDVLNLIEVSGFANILAFSEGLGFSAFFPANFDSMPAAIWDTLQSDRSILVKFVLGFVIDTEIYAREKFVNGTVLQAISGESLTVHVYDDGSSTVTRGNWTANVVETDILYYDGLIHIIDDVLYPPDIDEF